MQIAGRKTRTKAGEEKVGRDDTKYGGGRFVKTQGYIPMLEIYSKLNPSVYEPPYTACPVFYREYPHPE